MSRYTYYMECVWLIMFCGYPKKNYICSAETAYTLFHSIKA